MYSNFNIYLARAHFLPGNPASLADWLLLLWLTSCFCGRGSVLVLVGSDISWKSGLVVYKRPVITRVITRHFRAVTVRWLRARGTPGC